MLELPLLCFRPAFEAFLPKEILSALRITNQNLFIDRASNPKTDYYGTPDELILEVRGYLTFPGSYSKFEMEPIYPYNIQPELFKSLRNKWYIYTQDVYIHFVKLVHLFPLRTVECKFIFPVLSFYLRTKENEYGNLCKLVEFEPKKLVDLQERIGTKIQEASDESRVDFSKSTFDDVFIKVKEILPVNKKDPEYKTIARVFEFLIEKPAKNVRIYKAVITWIGIIIDELTIFIDQHPQWFLPKSVDAQNRKSEKEEPIIVRLFEDKSKLFVMEYELLNILEDFDTAEMNKMIDTKGVIRAIGFKELSGRLGTKMRNIEFVNTPIKRTKHAAVYIPSFNGRYCILAADLIVEMLRDLISVKNIFQKINQSNWEFIEALCDILPNPSGSNKNCTCFIDTEKAEEVKTNCDKLLKKYMGVSLEGTKDVREVGTYGFTLRDLKKEIQYLGLTEAFPQILICAETVYNRLVNSKKKYELRTCDMYVMLEHCQFVCLFSRNPKLLKYIHEQGHCGHFVMECPFCAGNVVEESTISRIAIHDDSEDIKLEHSSPKVNRKSTNSKPKTPESAPLNATNGQSDDVTSEIVPVEETHRKLEDSEDARPKSSSSNVAGNSRDSKLEKRGAAPVEATNGKSEDVSSENHEIAETEKMNKKKEKRRRAAEKKKMAKQQSEAPRNEESNVCKKCFRASQICNAANEALRLEQVKTRALTKELAKVTQRELKQEEENQKLREKLAALQETVRNMQVQVSQETTESDDTSTSNQKDQHVVLRAPTWKNSELTSEMRNMLFELLNTRDCLLADCPTKQATDIANRLMMRTKNQIYQRGARIELKKFHDDFKKYFEAIEKNIELIRNNKKMTLDQLPKLPEYPTFSESFMKAYDEVVNGEELEDQDCLICLHEMKSFDGTIKCQGCKRRFHNDCASEWFEVKKECPTCDKEFSFDK